MTTIVIIVTLVILATLVILVINALGHSRETDDCIDIAHFGFAGLICSTSYSSDTGNCLIIGH